MTSGDLVTVAPTAVPLRSSYADALTTLLRARDRTLPQTPLVVVSSATTTEIVTFLRATATDAGRDWSTTASGPGPVQVAAHTVPPECALVVVIGVEDAFPELGLRADTGWTRDRVQDLLDTAGQRCAALACALRDVVAGRAAPTAVAVLQHRPVPLPLADRSADHRLRSLPRLLDDAVHDALSGTGAVVLDVEGVLADLPRQDWVDDRLRLATGSPASTAAAARLGRALDAALCPRPPAKVIVTDLDSTLWRGVISEDGPSGIGSQPYGPEHHHRVWQRTLACARAHGVLLAVASRNDPDALRPLREADLAEAVGMVLEEADFAATSTSWQPKSAQLRDLATRLDLPLDALVLVDDNPVELAEVSATVPQVRTLAFPADGSRFGAFLDDVRAAVATTGGGTAEDAERTRWYRQRAQMLADREQARSVPEYLDSLVMRLDLAPVAEETTERARQLLNRTNQFTLTGHRYDESAWAELRATPGCHVYTGRLTDSYGDHGICAVAVLLDTPHGCRLRELAVSCRVFHRTVETALLRVLAGDRDEVVAEVVDTGRNARVGETLGAHGFRRASGGADWVLVDRAALDAAPLHVTTTGGPS